MKIGHFSKLMKLNIHLLLCSKRHYIDEIEHPPSPICGEKPQFESNVTSFQFRQNASAFCREKTRYAHKIQQIQHFLSSFQYRKKNSFRHWLEERGKSAAANALDVQQKNVTNVIIAWRNIWKNLANCGCASIRRFQIVHVFGEYDLLHLLELRIW